MTRLRMGVVLFVALAVVLSTGTAAALTTGAGDANGNAAALAQAGGTTITFENQTSEGRNVTIGSVNLSEGGFVAIHTTELLNGSVLGSIVGTSAYLEPGEHEDVAITLNESLDESATFIAVAYRDTNGNEEYDFVDSQGSEDGAYVVDNQIVVDDAVVTPGPPATETTQAPTTEAPTTEAPTELLTTEVATESETTVAPVTTVAAETSEVPAPETSEVAPTEELTTEIVPTEVLTRETTEAVTQVETSEELTEAPTEIETSVVETTEGVTAVGSTETTTTQTEVPGGVTPGTATTLPEETPSGVGGPLAPGQPGFGPLVALAGLAGGALYLLRRRDDDR